MFSGTLTGALEWGRGWGPLMRVMDGVGADGEDNNTRVGMDAWYLE